MADADLTILVVDGSVPFGVEDRDLIERARRTGRFLIAANKADLPLLAEIPEAFVAVSALTGAGIEEMRRRILECVSPEGVFDQEAGFITSLRHEQLLRESVGALGQALEAAGGNIPHEMVLLDLYSALRPIDAITGATSADDILNRIFATFCIGQ